MSSKQTTLGHIASETPEQAEWHSGPSIGAVPNFDREGGQQHTELGAGLTELCDSIGGKQ